MATALTPQSTTRSPRATTEGSSPTVSPRMALRPASLAGEQMVRASWEAPSRWKKAWPALRCTSPMVPA